MNVTTLSMPAKDARSLWREYKEHRASMTPMDREIAAIYQRIAQGRTVVRALQAIREAGLNEQGLPKLAIARADQHECFLRASTGVARFQHKDWLSGSRSHSKVIDVRDWPAIRNDSKDGRAAVPIIPIHLRPKRGLQNYHILWNEAEERRRHRDMFQPSFHETPDEPKPPRREDFVDNVYGMDAYNKALAEYTRTAEKTGGVKS